MFYDRKNIHPDYLIEFFISKINFDKGSISNMDKIVFNCTLNIENTGKRPASISDISLKMFIGENGFSLVKPLVTFDMFGRSIKSYMNDMNLIVKANDIKQYLVRFYMVEEYSVEIVKTLNRTKENISKFEVSATLNNGKKLLKEATVII